MADFYLEPGPIPLHRQVYLDLRRALDAGRWQVGDRLPTERELASRYGCSLITVRHALGELVHDGRLERTRGRGTFVLPTRIDHDFAGPLSFSEDMRRRGLVPSTRVVDKRIVEADAATAAVLRLASGAPVYRIERLRLADDDPMLLEQAVLPADAFPGLLEIDLEGGSLYDALAQRYATPVASSSETVEPVMLPRREAGLLDVQPRSLALLVIGTASTRGGIPVEHARSFIRTDRTRYRLDRVVHRPAWSRTFESAAAGQTKGGAPIDERVAG